MSDVLFLVCHVQRTSARVTFLRHPNGSLSWPFPIDEDAQIVPEPTTTLSVHPGAALTQLRQSLGLSDPNELVVEGEFREWLSSGETTYPVLLARLTAIDPPSGVAEKVEGRFVTLMEARRRPAAEMALLRSAYETLLTG